MKQPFKPFEANVTSQGGEDGVLAEVFQRIGIEARYFIEFGAWDGRHLSNTWTLWNDHGWSGMLIEGVASRFEDLKKSTAAFPGVKPVCAFVTPEGANALDALVQKAGGPQEPDLLSVDIDGDEYHILQGLNWLKPRVIVAEFNPMFPPGRMFVQKPGEYVGSSASSMMELMQRKGYEVIHITSGNLFFVRKDLFPKLGIAMQELRDLFLDDHIVHVITAYDGTMYFDRPLPFVPAGTSINDYAASLSFKERLFLLFGRPVQHPFATHRRADSPDLIPVKTID